MLTRLLLYLIILTFALASAQTNDGITNPDSVFPDETVGLNSCTTGWTNGFYKKYAKLESSFGAYDSWPSYAKEELLPFFSVSSIEQLDDILADKYGYGRIDMVTLYSVIVGDYNAIPLFWDEKTRLQYSDLLLKYNLANGGWIDVIGEKVGGIFGGDGKLNLDLDDKRTFLGKLRYSLWNEDETGGSDCK